MCDNIDFTIRNMCETDRVAVLEMMTTFYSSNAVSSNGSMEIFTADYDNCINSNPFLEGYIFQSGSDIIGYAMIAKSFSTEFGKQCIWFEDLYLKEQYRGKGLIPKVIKYIEDKYFGCVFKLETEEENIHAIHVYKKLGFEKLPYFVMKKL